MNFIVIFFISVFFLFCSFRRAQANSALLYVMTYVFLMCCVIGSRSGTPDTVNYLEFYEEIEPGRWESFLWYSFEPGFQFFTHIVKMLIGYNPFAYLFLVAAIIGILVCDGTIRILHCMAYDTKISTVKQPLLFAFVIFYAYYGLFYSAIAIRAGIALSLYLEILSIFCLSGQRRKKFLWSVVLFSLAFLFHTSIIVAIPILFIFCLTKTLSLRSYLLLLMIALLIFFSRVNILFVDKLVDVIFYIVDRGSNIVTKFLLYTDVLLEREIRLSFKYMFQLFSGFIFMFGNLNDKVYTRFLNVYIVGILLGSVLAPIPMAYRILDFFYIFTFILYVQLFLYLKFCYTIFYVATGILIYQILLIYRVIYA